MSLPPYCVLVVEDDPTSRKYLEIALTKYGYRVEVAGDAEEAQELLAPNHIENFSCVVTDYRMPNQSGLELLAWIKTRDTSLSTILVTAEGEKGLVTESLRGGAIDFLDKPVDLKKLQIAVSRACERTQQHRHMAKSESTVKELGKAQLHMLGVEALQNSGKVEVCFYPKHEAGGDFLTRFRPDHNRYFYLLTDVSGHDCQAAYISAYFQGMVRGMLARGAPANEIFPEFNRFLLEEWNKTDTVFQSRDNIAISVAACSLIIDFSTQTATVFTLGTPAPVYFLPDGEVLEVGQTGGFPLGWFSECALTGATRSIAAGGFFYLWTDGLEDLAENQNVSALSLASVLQAAKKQDSIVPCIQTAKDDILLATIQLSNRHRIEEVFHPLICERYHGAQYLEIDEFQAFWSRSLLFAVPDLLESRLHDILLASREALLNALNHGCGREAERFAFFQISYCPSAKTIRVRVNDSGPGHTFNFDQYEHLAATELVEEHRGLILVKHLADTVLLQRNGASILMDFHMQEQATATRTLDAI